MSTRIGVNGFGRMGRLALRAAWDWPEFEFAHINELKGRRRDQRDANRLAELARTVSGSLEPR